MSDEGQKIIYRPYRTTAAFHRDNSSVRAILGPVGSSKSSACCVELSLRAGDQAPDANGWRRTSWVVVRQSYPALISTTIKTWQQWCPQAKVNMSPPFRWHWKQENAGHDADGKPDGTHIDMEVNFMSVSDPRQDINKIRSLNITGVWINEVQELLDVSLIKYLYSRCGRYPDPQVAPLTWSGLIMDANAMDLDHWYYQYAEIIKPQGWKFFRQPPAVLKITDEKEMQVLRELKRERIIDQGTHVWKINPECENVKGQPKHENYWLDQIEGNHESWIAINLEAKYGQSMEGRPVFVEFDETRHVAKEEFAPIPGIPIQLGFDFGLTPACCITQITPQGQLRIIDEVIGESMGMRQFMRDALKPILAAQYPGFAYKGVGEPAGNQRAQSDESTAMDEIRAAGIECIPAPTNFFGPRRDAVASFMLKRVRSTITGKATEEGFLISPKCKMLLKGFRGDYKFKRVKVEGKDVYEAEAVKNEASHIQDSVQAVAVAYDRPRIDANARNRMGNRDDGSKFSIGFATDYPSI